MNRGRHVSHQAKQWSRRPWPTGLDAGASRFRGQGRSGIGSAGPGHAGRGHDSHNKEQRNNMKHRNTKPDPPYPPPTSNIEYPTTAITLPPPPHSPSPSHPSPSPPVSLRPPFRLFSSGPWQAKHLSERMGRIWALKSTSAGLESAAIRTPAADRERERSGVIGFIAILLNLMMIIPMMRKVVRIIGGVENTWV